MEKKREDEDEMQFGPQVAPSGRIVPLSERQQMALLKKIEEQRKQSTSPKPDNLQERRLYNKLNKRNDRGETPLHRATIRGDQEKVVELLQQGADVNCKDFAGWTALHEACNHGYLDIVKTLIDHGADVNVSGLDGDTPLHDAAVNGHEEITIVLIQSGGNPESENDKKETPVEVAEEEGTRRLLLEGIPVYKDFEKRRKKERDRLRDEKEKNRLCFPETENEQRGDEKIQTSRLSSDFDSEDDLPISHLKVESAHRKQSVPNDEAKSMIAVMQIPGSPEKGDVIHREEKKIKKEKTDSEDSDEKKKKKPKKNRKDDEKKLKTKDEIECKSKEDKDKARIEQWSQEIERKIRLEAQEKGIDLTQEQLEKVRDRRLKKLTKKMAEKKKSKENKITTEISPSKEKTVEKTDVSAKTTGIQPLSKSSIQSPSYDAPQLNSRQAPFSLRKEHSPKTPKPVAVHETKKEKVSPVVLPKLDGILTPKREKKESSDSVLSPDEEKVKSKKRKTDEKDQKEVKKIKIKEHNFLDQNQDLLKLQKRKQKDHAEKQRRIREKEKALSTEIKRQKVIESIKDPRERSNSTSLDPMVTVGEKRDRRESVTSLPSGPPKEKRVKTEERRPSVTPIPDDQVKLELKLLTSVPANGTAESKPLTTSSPANMTTVPKHKVFVPNVPPSINTDLKINISTEKTLERVPYSMSQKLPSEMDQKTDSKVLTTIKVIESNPIVKIDIELVPIQEPCKPESEVEKVTGPKRPFKPKRAWLTESAQAVLEKRLEFERTNHLDIEPLTKTKLSDHLREICKYKNIHERKSLIDENLNDFDERYHIKKRLKNQWKALNPIVPSAPDKYWTFSIFTGNYHLSTSIQDRLAFPKNAPPSGLHPKLKLLFVAQEDERWQMLQRHTVQREKLRIAYEQEILRTHTNAKRLEENQPKPYSACMVLQAEFENQYELSKISEKPEVDNKRDRFTPGVLSAMIEGVKNKFGEKCENMLKLQEIERDSCYQLQKTEWLLQAQVYDREYLGKDASFIPPEIVREVKIDDFKMFHE